MVTDGLKTNQPGSQDLCPGTSSSFKYVCGSVLVCMCAYVECVCSYVYMLYACAFVCLCFAEQLYVLCVQLVKPVVCVLFWLCNTACTVTVTSRYICFYIFKGQMLM